MRQLTGARARRFGVPADHRWVAVGGGFGVAWPIVNHVALVGAVPVDRKPLMMAAGTFEPDAAAVRSALGLEVGWR